LKRSLGIDDRKGSTKKQARDAWKKACKVERPAVIVAGLNEHIKGHLTCRTTAKWLPYLANWLSNEKWTASPERPRRNHMEGHGTYDAAAVAEGQKKRLEALRRKAPDTGEEFVF
jgi:hypothetical protein